MKPLTSRLIPPCFLIFLLLACGPAIPESSIISPPRTQQPTRKEITFPPTIPSSVQPKATPTSRPFEKESIPIRLSGEAPFALSNGYAFLVSGGRLVVEDLSDLAAPTRIWQSEQLGREVSGIAVMGYRIFLLADGALQIWEATDVFHPNLLSSIWVGEQRVAIVGARLYLVSFPDDEVCNITTFDLTQPGNPQELGKTVLDLPKPHRWMIIDKHMYGLYDGHVELFDLSNPSRAVLLASLAVPTDIRSQVMEKSNSLLIGTHSGVWVFDISNPRNPQGVAHYQNLPVDHLGIIGDRGYLITSICEGEETEEGQVVYGCGIVVEVVDFSLPNSPSHLGYVRLRLAEGDFGYIEEARFLKPYAFLKSSIGFWYALDFSVFDP